MTVISMPGQDNNEPTQEEIIAKNAGKGFKTPFFLRVLLHSDSQLIQTLLLMYGFNFFMLGVLWLAALDKDPKYSASNTASKILIGGGSCAMLIGLVGVIASTKYAQKLVGDARAIETTSNISIPQ